MVSKEWRTLSNFYVRKTLPVAECGVHWTPQGWRQDASEDIVSVVQERE